MAKVCQLFSGSSGNSIFVSSNGHNYLVDIGVSAKKCEGALMKIGIEPESIEGIFVTHEHIDHAKGIRVFANRYKTPVFASPLCIDEMKRANLVDEKTNINSITNHLSLDGIETLAAEGACSETSAVSMRGAEMGSIGRVAPAVSSAAGASSESMASGSAGSDSAGSGSQYSNHLIKRFNPETDKKYCYMFPPSSYSDVILTDKEYGEQLWNRYSQYNPSESYKDISKAMNFGIIFKVLSPAMLDKLQSIINKEYLDLRGTLNRIDNFKGMD